MHQGMDKVEGLFVDILKYPLLVGMFIEVWRIWKLTFRNIAILLDHTLCLFVQTKFES